MTINEVITGLTAMLHELEPEKEVLLDQETSMPENSYFVHCTKQSYHKQLGRRRKRLYSFELMYFPTKRDHLSFYHWAESMYQHFEYIRVSDGTIAVRNASASLGEKDVSHFTFDIEVFGVIDDVPDVLMEQLQMKEELKP